MPITIVPYNPTWPLAFETIKHRLDSLLTPPPSPTLTIHHIGSTSVPTLAAKPTIDISIVVPRAYLHRTIATLVAKGNFTNRGERGIPDRWCVVDPEQDPPRNVYVCVDGAAATRNHLAVRDVLRRVPELRAEYAALKWELAAPRKGIDMDAYVEAKSEVLMKILGVAACLSEEEMRGVERANRRRRVESPNPKEEAQKKKEKEETQKKKKEEKKENIIIARIEPPVHTARLLLREFVAADEAPFFHLESRDDVVRYQTWAARTRDQARDQVAKTMRSALAVPRTVVELAVVEHGGGAFIGRVGAKLRRESDPPHADLWFSFVPEWQGRGLATEAMEALVALLGAPWELEIECDPRNRGSWRMAERLGFEQAGVTERAVECKGEWVGSLVYRKRV